MKGPTVLTVLAFGAASVCAKYEVLNCYDQFPLVAQAIKAFTAALSPIILDVKKSAVNPSEAYTAFFKDPASTPFIEQVLTDAKTGVHQVSIHVCHF